MQTALIFGHYSNLTLGWQLFFYCCCCLLAASDIGTTGSWVGLLFVPLLCFDLCLMAKHSKMLEKWLHTQKRETEPKSPFYGRQSFGLPPFCPQG